MARNAHQISRLSVTRIQILKHGFCAARPVVIEALRAGLAECQALHHFELIGELTRRPEDNAQNTELWLILIDIISLIAPQSLKHLTLKLVMREKDFPFPRTRSVLDWEALRVACRRLKRLESLTLGRDFLLCDPEPWDSASMDYAMSEMEYFHRKGILFFDLEPRLHCRR